MTKTNFLDERHALYVGCTIGVAMRNGVMLRPVVDEDGDYTEAVELELEPGITLTLVVPPPPPEWTLQTWAGSDG